MNVVIIDDTEVNAKVISTYVTKLENVKPSIFTDPTKGLAYCLENDVDIILVDYKMPVMDGLELIRRIRMQPDKSGVPIVMITAVDEREVLRTALDTGANDFLTKLVDELELTARLRNMLSLREYVLELKRLATIDSLTAVYNRRYFLEDAEKEFARACRYEKSLSILMLDADKFKRVNDQFGHSGGDAVLVELASICRSELREVDFMGRLGGEEFAICLSETNSAAAALVAERLRCALEDTTVVTDLGKVNFTVSIGFTAKQEDDCSLSKLLNRADRALYAAKSAGRNRIKGL